MDSFKEKLAHGQVGESVISKWLQSRGHMVFPAYQIEQEHGKGPQLYTASGNLVLPDLFAFRAGGHMWFEVKHKTCFTWHRNSGFWTTGIDLRHYNHYIKVANCTDLPVWLMFLHPLSKPSNDDLKHGCPAQCPTGLFGGEIGRLCRSESHRSPNWGRSGMVYWTVDSLRRIADADEVMSHAAAA